MNIGTRVSFSPRNAPAAATWMPSENWKMPASTSSCAARRITCVLPVYSAAMACGKPSINAVEKLCVSRVSAMPL